MRSVRTFVAVVWMLMCIGGHASAQGSFIGTLSEKDYSVTRVMQRVGCNRGWLSQVIADSRINPAKLKKLPVGQKLYLSGGSCKENPPAQIANLSGMILRMDLDSSQAQSLRTELTSLRSSAEVTEQQVKDLTVEKEKLQLKVTSLEEQLDKARRAEREANERAENESGVFFLPAAVGLVSGMALACYATIFWFRRMTLSFRKVVTVRSHGKSYRYELVDAAETVKGSRVVAGRYKCPLCSAHDVFRKNLVSHIETKHPGERMKVDSNPSLIKASGSLQQQVP